MNFFKIIIFALLLTSFSAFSQDYGRFGGVNRDIGGRDYSSKQKAPSTEEIEQMRLERVEKFTSKLKTDLILDELQVIAIKNELISNSKNIDIVLKKEDSEEAKSKEASALLQKTETIINSYLSKVQKEKYKVLIAEMTSKKKDKKEKKNQKNVTTTTE